MVKKILGLVFVGIFGAASATIAIFGFLLGCQSLEQCLSLAKTKPIFGPKGGTLPFLKNIGVEEFDTGLSIKDFEASVEIVNPPQLPWDYGLTFRKQGINHFYSVILYSNGECALWLRSGTFESARQIMSIKPNLLSTKPDGTNKLTVHVKGDQVEIKVNGNSIGSYRIDDISKPGQLILGTEFSRDSDGVNKGSLTYKDFTVFRLE